MQEQLAHKQQALGAGIRMSDARRRHSEEGSPGLVLQYELILGFLQKIGPVLAEYPELHMFYFPVESEQLLCVYRTADMPEPLPVELRPYLIITLASARQLFTETLDERFLSSYHKPLEDLTYQNDTRQQDMVMKIILATLGGHLPPTHPKAATSLVICCPIPDKIAAASKRLRDLSGLLILFGDEENFSQSSHSSLVKTVGKEFNRYIEETGQYAIRELDFFLSSLISQDERIQDNQNRALGIIAHMVVHRFRNFRQVADFIVQEYPTAQEVSKDPGHYEEKIQAMKTQLNRAGRLEKQLQYVERAPQKMPVTLGELVDIFEYVFNEMKKQTKSSIELESDISDSYRTESVLSPPQPVIEEVFYNHLENMFRALDRLDEEEKKLSLQSHPEEKHLCLDLINYGPALASDILEDLQRLVRVSRPSGSGLGMFLSAMIMRHVGGDQEVNSPVPGKDTGVCITFKFPRP
ncbi:MAG: ATP-binding protein [Ktedonobacteraceae bacterium]